MRKIVLALIVLSFCSEVQATQYVDSLRLCVSDTHDAKMSCDVFLMGMMDGIAAASSKPPYCIPDGVPLDKIKALYAEALHDKANQNRAAGAVLLHVLRKSFPCK